MATRPSCQKVGVQWKVRKAVGNPRRGPIVFRPGMNTDRSENIYGK